MAGLVRTIIDLKARLESVEKKVEESKKDDLEGLIGKQIAVDEAIATNSAAILKIEEEIKVLSCDPNKMGTTNNNERRSFDKKIRKCRYYDRGYCKYKCDCNYFHSKNICKDYLENGKCENKSCMERHPKVCKFWLKSRAGCKRDAACDFLHVTLAQQDKKRKDTELMSEMEFNCIGCQSSWQERRFIIQYNINNQIVNFCLNCNDWVKDKSKVLDVNWTMFDDKGNLRYDV